MRIALSALFSLVCSLCVAQFKLVPQSKLDSIANPRTVASMLAVEQQIVDLGRVAESDVVQTDVAVINRGRSTIVYRARTTCRCLSVADIAPLKGGQSGKITLSFAGKGHPGPFEHKVFVYTADSESTPTAVVRVKGYVVADADLKGDYPYHCGGLLMRQAGVKFSGTTVERIACKNGTSAPLRVTTDTLLSSDGVTVKTEPEVLMPGQCGDVVVTVKTEKREFLKLYIAGQSAPRTREIKIE